MKTNSIQTRNTTSNRRLLVLLAMLLLSSVGMFGQELKNEVVAPSVIEFTTVASVTNTASQLELVSWFMGSNQSVISTTNAALNTTSTNNSGKKQFINCGMTPNRILSRTFLKKAINHDSTIA